MATGAAGALATLCADAFGPLERVLIITDAGVRGLGLLNAMLDGFAAAGVETAIFDAVTADPADTVMLAGADAARAQGAQAVIGFGGGSPMDTAKVVRGVPPCVQPLAEMYGVGQVRGPRLPLALIPTTAGTGSEVTPVAVVTTGADTKAGVSDPILIPDLAVLDPALTVGLPPAITAYTGIDAMVHAIEAYTSKLKKNPLSDAAAVSALRLLAPALPRAMAEGGDLDARRDMLVGAMLAGQAFANAPVAAVHAMAYPLGGMFHVPHGLSNAVVLTEVLRFNAPAAEALYGELAAVIGAPATAAGLIDALERLIAEAGIERGLSQFGVSHNHLPKMAEAVAANTRLLPNNPRDVAYEDALKMYEAVL